MVWGTPKIMPEWRTGWMVMVAVGTIKLRRALTASGIPMECPPPSTTAALGLEMLAMSSASASPASTSPPTVLSSTSSPSMPGSSCTATSWGMTCSYLVVFWPWGASTWPSTCPTTVRQWMACLPRVRQMLPRSSICSCSSRCCSTGLLFSSFVFSAIFHPPGRFFSGFPGRHGAIPKAKNLSPKILSKGFDILVSGCILYIK